MATFLGTTVCLGVGDACLLLVPIPVVIKIILKYLDKEIEIGNYKERVSIQPPDKCLRGLHSGEEEASRSDAKAENEEVGLGGWEVRGGKRPDQARWFSIKLTRRNAPWVFEGGEP